jgi:hypothetical protein
MTTSTTVKIGNLQGIKDGDGKRGRVIITHGAGRGMDAAILVKTAMKLAEMGFTVLRFNFAYLGKRPAPSFGGKTEQLELIEAVEYMKGDGPLIVVGKSFGARVATYVAAERGGVDAIGCYGLPLQGISKTSKPRDWSHMEKLTGDILFVTGNNDKLCPMDQLAAIEKRMRARVASHVVPGDHSFKPKSEDRAIEICVDWLDKLVPTRTA